jgi:hypothetical protein
MRSEPLVSVCSQWQQCLASGMLGALPLLVLLLLFCNEDTLPRAPLDMLGVHSTVMLGLSVRGMSERGGGQRANRLQVIGSVGSLRMPSLDTPLGTINS